MIIFFILEAIKTTDLNLDNILYKLYDRDLKLDQLEITSDVFMLWKEEGIISSINEPISLKETRLNAFEALWLLIVKELRQLDIKIETIIKLEHFMFEALLDKALEGITEGQYDKTRNLLCKNEDKRSVIEKVSYSQTLVSSKEMPEEKKIFSTRIGAMLGLMVISDENPSIHLYKNPDSNEVVYFEFYPTLSYEQTKDSPEKFFSRLLYAMSNSIAVNIPLRPLLNTFFKSPLITDNNQSFKLYSSQEKRLLDVFRTKDFEKMIIHKNEMNQTMIIEKTKKKELKGEQAKELRKQLKIQELDKAEVISRNGKHMIIKQISKETL